MEEKTEKETSGCKQGDIEAVGDTTGVNKSLEFRLWPRIAREVQLEGRQRKPVAEAE